VPIKINVVGESLHLTRLYAIYIFPAKSIDETTINEKQSQPWENKYPIGCLNVALLELPQT